MIACEKGAVALVPFPFSDQTITKKRPAVIISSNIYNKISSAIVIMAITSQTTKTNVVILLIIFESALKTANYANFANCRGCNFNKINSR
jgi:mRNA-degrading endonuclease toxin of MazEF toxin-antitoxin module